MSTQSTVEIGIATKNRWKELKDTLLKISYFGLSDLRTLIFDDASDEPCPFDVSCVLPRAQVTRFAESKGYIVRRNHLARAMESRYYLSFDDDSFPVSGSLEAAIEFAESREDLFCLSFPVYNPISGIHQIKSLLETPYPARSFIGCAHLLRRERFLELGGYCEEFVHNCEEGEVAARAFQRGLNCYHFPGMEIHHTESNSGRSRHRMDYYGARNTVLWNDWYVPDALMLAKQARTFIGRLIQTVSTRRIGIINGEIAGLRDIPRFRTKRHRLSLQSYQEWQSLPPF